MFLSVVVHAPLACETSMKRFEEMRRDYRACFSLSHFIYLREVCPSSFEKYKRLIVSYHHACLNIV